MKNVLALLLLAATSALVQGATAAPAEKKAANENPVRITGAPADLNKAMDVRAAKLGNIASPGSFSTIPNGDALYQTAFSEVASVERLKDGTSFLGRHTAIDGTSDYALVVYPGDLDIADSSAALVIGTFGPPREIRSRNGATMTVPVITARVVGMINGGEWKKGRFLFAPDAEILIYEAAAKK
jgi:hypothetical protein